MPLHNIFRENREKMIYILIFDIPRENPILAVKVNRKLKEINAEKIQNSVWRSENLEELTKIALWIRNSGGKAQILEEKIVF
jgi:CRISPR/Cas system-associated endoribonuclease Cas2